MDVLLGYEIGTGKPINLPLHHVVVTGVTQLSGKTTTLEALIGRANLKALAFRTKRGEAGFEDAYPHAPFFRQRADWQYVQSLLEATMREKMKFERSWIIKVCKGARTLREVLANVERELFKAKGLSESVYTNLRAYLEIVLPELEHTQFVNRLDLREGVNMMDLIGLREEVQSLVIASCLEAVYERERDVVIVIPEAWKFCPEGRGNPVKRAAENLIRQGATVHLYLWFDSQDMAGVDKALLKQVDNWILGRQREINEVEHTLAQVPVHKSQKPRPEDIMQLHIGHFFACYGDQVRRVYVRPSWLDEARAIEVAMGKRRIDSIFREVRATEVENNMEQEERKRYEREIEDLRTKLSEFERPPPRPVSALAGDANPTGLGPQPQERKEYHLNVSVGVPSLTLTERIVRIAATDEEPTGRFAKLIAEGFFDERKSVNEVQQEFQARGWTQGKLSGATWNNADRLGKKFAEWGFLRNVDRGYVVIEESKRRIKRVRSEE